METQSTVIVSFQSSQTPVESQLLSKTAGTYVQQHQQKSEHQHSSGDSTTPFDNTITQTLDHTPSILVKNSPISTTAFNTRTPKNNVLKKVASFTIQKSAACCTPIKKNNNADSYSATAGQLDNIESKRLLFVPEKLKFAAYEKFEGKSKNNLLQFKKRF